MRSRKVAAAALVLIALPRAGAAQEDAFSLEGLVVTASPTPRALEAVANHVTVLDGTDLRAGGLRSVADALREVAGVDVVRNGSFGAVTSVFLRGGESDHTLVLVDGMQLNQAGGAFDFASLTTDDVERIEILRGPQSALYGSDAVAGVIHIITRTGPGPTRAEAAVEMGSYREPRGSFIDGFRWSANLAGGADRSGYSVSLVREETDGVLAFNNRYANTVLSGRARVLPDAATRIDMALRLANREYHFPTDNAGAVVDRNAFTYGDDAVAHVSVGRRISERLEVEARLGVNGTDGGTDDQQDDSADTLGFYAFNSLDHFRRASGELRASLGIGGAIVTSGWELEQERQRSFSESESEFGPSSGRSESRRWNQAGFVQVTGEHSRLAYNAGMRLERNQRFGTVGTWQAGLSVGLVEGGRMRLRGSLGSAIKEPTFFENFATGFVVGNPDLDPERSLAWEAGVDHELVAGVANVHATYFEARFEDLIQYTSTPAGPGDPNYFNVAGARSRGLELGVDVRASNLLAGIAWTWLDTEVTDAGFDNGPGATFVKGEALLRRPSHTFAFHASRRVGSEGRVYARLSFVGAREDRDFSTLPAVPVELSRYGLLSVGGQWNLLSPALRRPRISLSARVENLLGEEYEEVLGFAAPGRQLYVGVSLGLGEGA